MRIIEYFTLPEDERGAWLAKIGRSDWAAARFLAAHIADGTFRTCRCPNARLLLAVEDSALMGFCTLSDVDDVQPTELTPWIGFVYTFPEYRGNRLSGALIDHACEMARGEGRLAVYLSTGEAGLYEKYGFEYLEAAKNIRGGDTRIYRRTL